MSDALTLDVGQIQKLIQKLNHLVSQSEEDNLLRQKQHNIIHILDFISRPNSDWHSDCLFSYRFVVPRLQSLLDESIPTDKLNNSYDLDLLLLHCIHFVREQILSIQRKYPNNQENILYGNRELDTIWSWFIKLEQSDIHERWHNYFIYIKNELTIAIFNYYIGEKSFQAFLDFEKNINHANNKSSELKRNITQEIERAELKIQEIQRLESVLKEQKTAFNFVGLSSGFSDLLEKKEKSKSLILGFLFILGLLIITIPLVKVFDYKIKWTEISWQQMVTSIGLEFVLIYFFRIALHHYRSIQTQIMQLELRLSLCKFIQSYAEYAKEIKANDKESLEKFENLIFSSIVSNDEKIGLFDGIEQISSLIKEFKPKT